MTAQQRADERIRASKRRRYFQLQRLYGIAVALLTILLCVIARDITAMFLMFPLGIYLMFTKGMWVMFGYYWEVDDVERGWHE